MIDQDELARQTADDPDLQLELLALFLAQLRDLETGLRALGESCDQARLADLAALLHRVRGAASAVGARALARRLGHFEETLTTKPAAALPLHELRTEVDAASLTLQDLIAARRNPGLAKVGESR